MTIIAAALLSVAVSAAPAVEPSDALLLRAIILAENSPGPNPSQLGPAARHDNRTPIGHLRWIKETLLARGYFPNTYLVALCWRVGLEKATDPRRSKELVPYLEYAERVRNIVEAK